jgi:membrane-associated protein
MDLPPTGIHLLDVALSLLATHVYVITFFVAALENVFVVGAVTPGETTLLAAGFVASVSRTDNVYAPGVVLAALLGGVLGCNISYFIGRAGGRPLLERYGHRFAFGERRLRDAEAYFERHGSKTLVLARWAPGIKNFAPLLAGVSHMDLAIFEAYTLVGGAAYAIVMVALGFFFGSNFGLLLKLVSRAGWGVLAIGALLLALSVWERRRLIRHREEREFGEEAGSGDDDGRA